MIILFLIILIHIFLLSKLVFFPYPELFIYPYLVEKGLVPYKQIFDQHFPGVMFFPINLATLGIDSVSEMRLVNYLLVFLAHSLIYKISSKIFINSPRFLFVPNILFMLWHPFMEGYVLWVDSFAQVGLLISYYFFLSNSRWKDLITGITIGLVLLLKQTVFPLILILLLYFLLSRWAKTKVFKFIIGVSFCIILLILWVVAKGILKEFLYWTFTFNLTIFAQMGRKYGSIGQIARIIPLFLPTLIFLFFYFRSKDRSSINLLFRFVVFCFC